jgi:hypothetical protein
MDGLSPDNIAIVILYKEVREAPMVKTGIEVRTNKMFTNIRLHNPVKSLVAALLGLKKEDAM